MALDMPARPTRKLKALNRNLAQPESAHSTVPGPCAARPGLQESERTTESIYCVDDIGDHLKRCDQVERGHEETPREKQPSPARSQGKRGKKRVVNEILRKVANKYPGEFLGSQAGE